MDIKTVEARERASWKVKKEGNEQRVERWKRNEKGSRLKERSPLIDSKGLLERPGCSCV